MKHIILVLLLLKALYGADMQNPIAQFSASGGVTDLIYNQEKLYASTSAGSIDIFDISSTKLLQQIKVEKITDFMGDLIDSKIYSVDIIGDKILILSQAQKGSRRVHIYEDNKLKLLIPYSKKLYISKAKFLDANTILLALLGNEIISYDIRNKKEIYHHSVSQSKFSDFALSEDKSEVVIADESGNLKIFKTKDASLVKELRGQNLDNVFQVDVKNGLIATAGQDRRVVIYDKKSAYYKTADFLIYSVGLSPSARLAAYASDENNNVKVFKTSTQSEIGIFTDNKMTLTKILFINEKEFFVASDDKTINLYKIR